MSVSWKGSRSLVCGASALLLSAFVGRAAHSAPPATELKGGPPIQEATGAWNGGHVADCRKTDALLRFEGHLFQGFEGHFFLDYLVARQDDHTELRLSDNFRQQMEAVVAKLVVNLPAVGFDADNFYRSFLAFRAKRHDPQGQQTVYVWEGARLGLKPIYDLTVREFLPAKCLEKGLNKSEASPNLIPFAEQSRSGYAGRPIPLTRIKVNTGELDLLERDYLQKKLPEQISWGLIHEFLWGYAATTEQIRRVNKYLHSEAFWNDSRAAFVDRVQRDLERRLQTREQFLRDLKEWEIFAPQFAACVAKNVEAESRPVWNECVRRTLGATSEGAVGLSYETQKDAIWNSVRALDKEVGEFFGKIGMLPPIEFMTEINHQIIDWFNYGENGSAQDDTRLLRAAQLLAEHVRSIRSRMDAAEAYLSKLD